MSEAFDIDLLSSEAPKLVRKRAPRKGFDPRVTQVKLKQTEGL